MSINTGEKLTKMTEKEFTKHYLNILNSLSIENIIERQKYVSAEVQALADIDGISFGKALEKLMSIFIDQYFKEDDEKVAEQLQKAASGLMMMEFLL